MFSRWKVYRLRIGNLIFTCAQKTGLRNIVMSSETSSDSHYNWVFIDKHCCTQYVSGFIFMLWYVLFSLSEIMLPSCHRLFEKTMSGIHIHCSWLCSLLTHTVIDWGSWELLRGLDNENAIRRIIRKLFNSCFNLFRSAVRFWLIMTTACRTNRLCFCCISWYFHCY